MLCRKISDTGAREVADTSELSILQSFQGEVSAHFRLVPPATRRGHHFGGSGLLEMKSCLPVGHPRSECCGQLAGDVNVANMWTLRCSHHSLKSESPWPCNTTPPPPSPLPLHRRGGGGGGSGAVCEVSDPIFCQQIQTECPTNPVYAKQRHMHIIRSPPRRYIPSTNWHINCIDVFDWFFTHIDHGNRVVMRKTDTRILL